MGSFIQRFYGIEVRDIEQELKAKFKVVKTNQLSFDQVDFLVEGVKLTFFNEVGFNVPEFIPQIIKGNIKAAPLNVVGSMKIKAMFERNTFRDYYDVFVLLKEEIVSVEELVKSSISYHRHLKENMIRNRLQRWQYVDEEKGFMQLSPKYNLSIKEMGEYLISVTS